MFTGIVAAMGTVTSVQTNPMSGITRLELRADSLVDTLEEGGSLAVNGVCTTRVESSDSPAGVYRTDLMGETVRLTTLGALQPGDRVNLERCVALTDRLDGHVVQGHVDGVGTVLQIDAHGDWHTIRIGIPPHLAGEVARKGSIAVDGVSLTVTGVSEPASDEPWFEIGLIPTTLAATVLGEARVGSTVNVETDVFAKYTARLLAVREAR